MSKCLQQLVTIFQRKTLAYNIMYNATRQYGELYITISLLFWSNTPGLRVS